MRMIHKKKIGSLHIGSLMYVYPNKNPHRLVPAMLSCQGSGKNSATARASPGERATPSATPLFSPELLGASPEVKSQLAQADQAHRMEDLEGWKMLEPSAKIFSCAHTHRHRHEHRHRHRNTHTHAHSIFMYIFMYIYIHIYMIIYVYNCVWYIKLRNAASLRCKWSELSLSRLLQLRAALRMDSWRHDPSTERTCGHVAWNGVYSQSEGRPLCRSRQHPWCLTKNNAGFCEIILMNLNPTILFITWAILSCVACRGFLAGTRKLSWRDAENFKASFQYFNLSCPSSPSPEHWSSWFTAVPRSIVVSRVGEVTVRSPTFHQCWRGSSNEKQSPGCRIVNIRRYIQYQGIYVVLGDGLTLSLLAVWLNSFWNFDFVFSQRAPGFESQGGRKKERTVENNWKEEEHAHIPKDPKRMKQKRKTMERKREKIMENSPNNL